MQRIWACPREGCLAADVQQALEQSRPIALTTVLTTLDRLNTKGIVRRERTGKAYRYWAAVSEEQLQQRIVEGVLSNLIAQFPNAVAAYLARKDDRSDPEQRGREKLADLAHQVAALTSAPQEPQSDDPASRREGS